MQGFIVFDYASRFPEARKEITQWLAEGKLQRKETIIKGGLGAAEHALLDLYKGINTGMLLRHFLPTCLVDQSASGGSPEDNSTNY